MSDTQIATLSSIGFSGRCAINPVHASEGKSATAWLGKDGSLTQQDWKQALAIEGRCFTVTIGTLLTGIVGGGAATVPDADLPEGLISIPSGVVLSPLRVAIQGNCADAVANHNTLQAFVCVDRAAAWDGTGTCTVETAYNIRTDTPRSTQCTCRSAFNTVNITVPPVHHIDLARAEVKIDLPAAGETPVIVNLLYEPNPAPFIVGPAMLLVYFGGTTALTGYAQLYWAEWSKAELGI